MTVCQKSPKPCKAALGGQQRWTRRCFEVPVHSHMQPIQTPSRNAGDEAAPQLPLLCTGPSELPQTSSSREQLCFESISNKRILNKRAVCVVCWSTDRVPASRTVPGTGWSPGTQEFVPQAKNAVISSQIKSRATGHEKDGLRCYGFIYWIFLPSFFPPQHSKRRYEKSLRL